MRFVFAALGVIAIVVVIAVFVVFGFTSAPFDSQGESAVGKAQNGLGARYTVDAARLTATWSFTRDAQIVLRFDQGDLVLGGQDLQPGCYSGTVSEGEVLTINDAQGISFASPDSNSTCAQLP